MMELRQGIVSAEEEAINGKKTHAPWLVTTPISEMLPRGDGATPFDKGDASITLLHIINAFRVQRSFAPFPPHVARTVFEAALVHVRVEMHGRGSPSDMAHIYAMGSDEVVEWVKAAEGGEWEDGERVCVEGAQKSRIHQVST